MRCEDCIHEKVCEGYSNCEEVGLYEPKRPHGEWKTESAIDYLTEIGWLPEHDRILTERPQWIPCSERLPEKNGVYLVTGENGHVFEYDYSDFTTHNEKWSYCRNEIVAWMPLPEPYKKEGEEK